MWVTSPSTAVLKENQIRRDLLRATIYGLENGGGFAAKRFFLRFFLFSRQTTSGIGHRV